MFKTGLLVLTAPLGSLQQKLPAILSSSARYIQDTLYVHLQPGLARQPPWEVKNVASSADVKNLISNLYSHAAASHSNLDVHVLLSNITNTNRVVTAHSLKKGYEVVLTDFSAQDTKDQFVNFVTRSYPSLTRPDIHTIICDAEEVEKGKVIQGTSEQDKSWQSYNHVVLGGTFDNLHSGHKILLSVACLMCEEKITVGVTNGPMNAKKSLCELVCPTADRVAAVREFLKEVKPWVEQSVVEITDPFGPTIVEPAIDCIVVSQETVRGGEKINEIRKEKGMSQLEMYIIDLVEDQHREPEEEEKISSSSQRKRLLGTVRKPIKRNSSLPSKPYVIGLTGGIASGKSSICKRMEKLGAAIVDCDKLGHQAYQRGTETFLKVMAEFGEDVVGEDGEIDRRVLGSKVFGKKDRLTELNGIVWPAIAQLAQQQVQEYHQKGKSVVVLDAAVLLEAGWESMTHEVWAVVVPKQEAMKRIVDRNNLTETQALKRIESQLSNQERVEKANVVLSTLWDYDVTQKQVEKAWNLLQCRMQNTSNL